MVNSWQFVFIFIMIRLLVNNVELSLDNIFFKNVANKDTHKAYNLSFGDGEMSPCDGTDFRGYGFSVRLVKDVE